MPPEDEPPVMLSTSLGFDEVDSLVPQETVAPSIESNPTTLVRPLEFSSNRLSLKLDRGIVLSNIDSHDLESKPFPFELRTNAWFQ